MAYDSTGSGYLSGGKTAGSDLSPSVSPVSVSFSFGTAPRSPARSSGTFVCVLPWSRTTWPSRSAVSRVLLWTVESVLSEPLMTRNMVMRPVKGSAMVFQTNADVVPVSENGR